jgi:hypothetical protein
MKKRLGVLIALMVGSILVSACGGAQPVPFSALPSFPAAVELQPGQNAMADSIADSMRSALNEGLEAEIRTYELPADTTFAEVQSYFGAQMTDGDWAVNEALTTETETFSTVGWQRGRDASQQVLMLGYVPPILDAAPLLFVSLFGNRQS